MASLLALLSAVAYGIVDFAGGRAAREVPPIALACRVQWFGSLALLVLAPLLGGRPALRDLGWGGLSGLGSAVAIMFLYRGMRCGKISLVLPLAALVGAALPVLFAIGVLGDRPSAMVLAGMAGTLLAVWWIACRPGAGGMALVEGSRDALIAGAGVALQYACVAQADPQAGLWPILANRLASVIVVVCYARHLGLALRLPRGRLFSAAWIGSLAALSLALYLYATWQSLVSVAVVLASLYPAIPVLLSILLLGETLTPRQWRGLLVAAVSVGVIVQGA